MTDKLGDLIDQLHDIREEKRALELAMKAVESRYEEMEKRVIDAADKQGISSGKGGKAAFSIVEHVVPNVVDWRLFYAFIHKHKAGHLLQRRPSATACRELFEQKGAIPGVEKFTQRKLNLRTTST